MKVCIATSFNYSVVPWREDGWLRDALCDAGCSVDIRDWMRPAPWRSYDAIFVSSTWNIPSAPNEFKAWLAACEADEKKRLVNDHAVLKLGIEKDTYWKVLETAGDPNLTRSLTPTRFVLSTSKGFSNLVEECRETWPDNRLVFKPIISADSFNTFVFDPSGSAQAHDPQRVVKDAETLRQRLQAIWCDYRLRGIMAQPYLEGVEEGEMSATFVRDQLVGVVRKLPGFGPMPGNTRVPVTDSITLEALCDLGRRVVKAIAANAAVPVRTRLDVIPYEDGLQLLEVEMVDPNCNFSTFERSARDRAVKTLVNEIIAFAQDTK